jgi:hypothetical protein
MSRKENILNRAIQEVGYLEKKNSSNLDDKTANAGSANYTKYAKDYTQYTGVNLQAQAWCAMFVSWLFVQEYGLQDAKKVLNGNLYASCTACKSAFKVKGRFYTSNPQAGDLIIFNDSKGEITHIGIVEKVSGSTIYTIEGNTSSTEGVIANGGGVFKKSYSIKYNRINGFCRPDYEAYPLPVAKPVDVIDTIEWKPSGTDWTCYKNGKMVKAEWILYKNRWFYLSSDGKMGIGLQNIDGKSYYLNSDTNAGSDFGALMITNDLKQGNLEIMIVA